MDRLLLALVATSLPLSPAVCQQSMSDETELATEVRPDNVTATSFMMIEHSWQAQPNQALQDQDQLRPIVVAPRPSNFEKPQGQTGKRNFHRTPSPFKSSASGRSQKELRFAPLIKIAERKHKLPEGLLSALIWQESRFNPSAISPAGAAGLAQLMPATARDLGVTNRHDPHQSIDGGARYLRRMLDQFGSIPLALAAYNAGPNAVKRVGGIPRNKETPGYVTKVLQRWQSLLSLGGL